MKKAETMLRRLQELECRRAVRLHLPATVGDLLRLTKAYDTCPALLLEFYAMTDGLEADGVELWSARKVLTVPPRQDRAVPVGRMFRAKMHGPIVVNTRGEVVCETQDKTLKWSDAAVFLCRAL